MKIKLKTLMLETVGVFIILSFVVVITNVKYPVSYELYNNSALIK